MTHTSISHRKPLSSPIRRPRAKPPEAAAAVFLREWNDRVDGLISAGFFHPAAFVQATTAAGLTDLDVPGELRGWLFAIMRAFDETHVKPSEWLVFSLLDERGAMPGDADAVREILYADRALPASWHAPRVAEYSQRYRLWRACDRFLHDTRPLYEVARDVLRGARRGRDYAAA